MLTEIMFYDVNAKYSDETELAEMRESHLGEIIRIPSIGEIVELRKQSYDSRMVTKRYKVKEMETRIDIDVYANVLYICYLVGMEEIEEEKQKEESFDEFNGF